MSLPIPRKSVPLGGQDVAYRGLSFDDIQMLMDKAPDDLDEAFDLIKSKAGSGKEVTETELGSLMSGLFKQLPALVGMALACAMDDLDAADEFKKAPMGFTLASIEAVYELTVEEAGGPKKFYDRLLALISNLNPNNHMT